MRSRIWWVISMALAVLLGTWLFSGVVTAQTPQPTADLSGIESRLDVVVERLGEVVTAGAHISNVHSLILETIEQQRDEWSTHTVSATMALEVLKPLHDGVEGGTRILFGMLLGVFCGLVLLVALFVSGVVGR